MNEIKFFDTQINYKAGKFSMQPNIPTINNEPQPMELLFVLDFNNGKPIVVSFNKDQAHELLKELQRLVPLVNCFG
jgi:hypothetical protein